MTSHPADLEARFHQPKNWQWKHFERAEKNGFKRRLRYGYTPVTPQTEACIIVLPGLGEFGEKYFEFAHECNAKNIAIFVIDWGGQGLSTRYLDNPHKRHTHGFEEDIVDLNTWITDHIKPLTGDLPLIMMAHSMGGNIGAQYIANHQNVFSGALFSAPMWGIKATELMPLSLAQTISSYMEKFAGESYVPGGTDWHPLLRPAPGHDLFSHDPVRGAVYNQWCEHNPDLQVGGVTNAWLLEAAKACHMLFEDKLYAKINIPVCTAIAGQDMLVSNKYILKFANKLPHNHTLELKNARHEILMETDEIRDQFWDQIDTLIKNILGSNITK